MNNEEKILEMLVQMQSDMAGMKSDMADMKSDTAGMKERIDQIDERSQRTDILMEADLAPKLQLLYEGHGAIMDILKTLATKDRVEELEADIIVLKTAVKMLTQEVAELKKAQ